MTVWRPGLDLGGSRGARRRCRIPLQIVVLWLVLLPLLGAPASAQRQDLTLPPGFAVVPITVVYGNPSALAWLGDDLLIASQEGWLFRLDDASPASEPIMILDLEARIGKGPEQGLMGVAADPDFPSRPYIYVYYTEARDSGHCDVLPANCRNRVSRFTMGADGQLDPASEQTLIDTIMVGSLHNAGDLVFGRDRQLYITTGDAAAWWNSQNLTNLNGKILRVDRDGNPTPDNPFAGPEAESCQDVIRQSADGAPCPEIFAWGLRNPFRIAFNPNTPTDVFYINDVGQVTWEEIDLGLRGANYGWPEREGPCLEEQTENCSPAEQFIEPIYAYNRDSGCFAVTGGAFVPAGSAWGQEFAGKYLFADWGCGTIFTLAPGEDGRMVAEPLASGLTPVVPILFDPEGNRLFYGLEYGIVNAIIRTPEAAATPGP